MHCSKTKCSRTRLLLFPALLCILLSGCAGKRWTEPLVEEELSGVAKIITAMQQKERECADSLDADGLIFWKSPLNDLGVEGYIQLLAPSFLKFVVTNPLGQPVYAFASDGSGFQILHPRQYRHIRGNIRSLAVRKEVPQILVQGDWFAYFTGRLPAAPLKTAEVHRDASEMGIWLRIFPDDSEKTPESAWVHVDPLQMRVLGYLFLDSGGETLAEIVYGEQEGRSSNCKPKNEITITGLPWGSELTIQLKNIATGGRFSEKDFALPVPPGYTTQLQH